MNNKRRAELEQAISLIDDAVRIVEKTASQEQDSFDNLPEGIQESDRGQKMEEAISCLEEAASLLADAESEIQAAMA